MKMKCTKFHRPKPKKLRAYLINRTHLQSYQFYQQLLEQKPCFRDDKMSSIEFWKGKVHLKTIRNQL